MSTPTFVRVLTENEAWNEESLRSKAVWKDFARGQSLRDYLRDYNPEDYNLYIRKRIRSDFETNPNKRLCTKEEDDVVQRAMSTSVSDPAVFREWMKKCLSIARRVFREGLVHLVPNVVLSRWAPQQFCELRVLLGAEAWTPKSLPCWRVARAFYPYRTRLIIDANGVTETARSNWRAAESLLNMSAGQGTRKGADAACEQISTASASSS